MTKETLEQKTVREVVICSGCNGAINNLQEAYRGPSYGGIPKTLYHNKKCFDRFTED